MPVYAQAGRKCETMLTPFDFEQAWQQKLARAMDEAAGGAVHRTKPNRNRHAVG
jgi:hypothetical protein